jgi:hypothetical protein
MNESRRMRWAVHVARMEKNTRIGFWQVGQEDHQGELVIGVKIILKWIIGRCGGVVWTGLI